MLRRFAAAASLVAVLAAGVAAIAVVVDQGDDRSPAPRVGATPATAIPGTTTPGTATSTPVITPHPGIEHATGASDVILHASAGSSPLLQPPPIDTSRVFLYGDGRLLLREGPDTNRWRELRLNEEGVQRLLRAAVEDVRFFELPAEMPPGICTDLSTPVFELNAMGRRHTVSAYGLGAGDCGPIGSFDHAAYGRLFDLSKLLGEMDEGWFAPGEVLSEGAFEPAAVWAQALQLHERFEVTGRWPDAAPPLDRLGDGTALCGEEAIVVRRGVGESGQMVVRTPGRRYLVQARPLFPHEPGWAQCGLE